jgi:hypothetical protein
MAWLTGHDVIDSAVAWYRYGPILDQGQLGSCTGNAMAGLLSCEPFFDDTRYELAARFNEEFAVELYSKATAIDEFKGQYPPEDTGSSGLAVAKVAKDMGFFSRYYWAFKTTSLIYALKHGPVIVGVPWYDSMFTPDKNATVEARGSIVGGHEFVIRGYRKGWFLADNSWGTSWGLNGSFYFSVATWEKLRRNGADVTVPRI